MIIAFQYAPNPLLQGARTELFWMRRLIRVVELEHGDKLRLPVLQPLHSQPQSLGSSDLSRGATRRMPAARRQFAPRRSA